MAPLISRFVRKYPQVEVQLRLSVNPSPLTDDSFDVCIRFGAPPDARIIAKHLAPSRRLLCAAPVYLVKHGIPKVPNDLTKPCCIGIYVRATSATRASSECASSRMASRLSLIHI